MGQPPIAEKLHGIVEADETYIGGKAHGKRGRGAENKTPVFALVERGGRVRSFKTERVTAKNLKGMIRKHVATTSTIMTDDFLAYKGLNREFSGHETVAHGTGEYVRGNVHTNTAEGFFSLLKKGINGIYQHVGSQHLQRYLDEFNFRYDSRKITDGSRMVLAIEGAEGKRLTLR